MRNAFSLVELSIVLVILGLLTGGILAGQSLIRAAELRSVSTEYARFTAAANSFRDKYFGWPGDITNATKFWGQSANCPGTNAQGTTNGTTCDGNGNGVVLYTGTSVTTYTVNELFRFWQQLANAGLIEGTYNGVPGATSNYFASTGPLNSPQSKLSNGYWQAWQVPNATGSFTSGLFAVDVSPFALMIGGIATGNWNSSGIMRPEEAWNIDTKMDDGKPGRGKVTGRADNVCTTVNTNTNLDGEYNLTGTSPSACLLMFNPAGS